MRLSFRLLVTFVLVVSPFSFRNTIYEVEIFFRSLRRDGVKGVVVRLGIYFRQLASGVAFRFLRLPSPDAPTGEVVDFSFNAAGGLLTLQQVRSEILQLA